MVATALLCPACIAEVVLEAACAMQLIEVTSEYRINTEIGPSGEPIDDGRDRSAIHLSDCVKRVYPYEGNAMDGEQPWLRAWLGFVWERALEWFFKLALAAQRDVVRPPEQELEGVFGHPDGIDLADGTLEEYKLSWVSMKNATSAAAFAKKFPRWMMQAMGYLKMVGGTKVRFWVYWVSGDYSFKPGHGPQCRVYEVSFDQDEIDDNWAMVTEQRDAIRREKGEVS